MPDWTNADDSGLFAAVPDVCPDCETPLQVDIDLTVHDDDSMNGSYDVTCPACGYAKDGELP